MGAGSGRVRWNHYLRGELPGHNADHAAAIYGALESDFDAAVTLSVLVLGFSFVVILTARYLARKATEYQG